MIQEIFSIAIFATLLFTGFTELPCYYYNQWSKFPDHNPDARSKYLTWVRVNNSMLWVSLTMLILYWAAY